MKHLLVLLLLLASVSSSLLAQIPDSTFGEPTSFVGISNFTLPGVTGCDFDGREDRCFASLFLENGKIVLAGHSQGGDGSDFALVRLLADGKFDTLAGPEGQVRINLGYHKDSCLAAALYQTDLILMGGCVKLPGQNGYSNLIARVDTDGQLDASFGNNGHVIIDLPTENEMISRIIALPDGKILFAGNAFFGNSFQFPDSTTVFVGRLLPNGQSDSSFGTGGLVYRRYEYTCKSSLLGDLALDNLGRIVLSGGSYSPYPGNYYFDDFCTHNIHICRYLPDGQPDPGFGLNGMLELPQSKGRATALFIENDNKILLAGTVTPTWILPEPMYSFLIRLLPDGTPDMAFAENGRFLEAIGSVSGTAEVVDILKIKNQYFFGIVDQAYGDHSYFGLMRFTENGVSDSLFGTDGIFNTQQWLPTTLYQINQIHTLDSHSIYISGYYSKLSQNNMMICKVNLDKSTSLSESDPALKIKIYPNPVRQDKVCFDFLSSPFPEIASLTIYDIQGRKVLNKQVKKPELEVGIQLQGIANGLYFLELIWSQKRYVQKLLIQR